MKRIKNQRPNQRNLKFSLPKKFNTNITSLKTKNETKMISSVTSRDLNIKSFKPFNVKESPILCFPMNKTPQFHFFLERNKNIPLPYKNKTFYDNLLNSKTLLKKKVIKSKLNRPVINLKTAKILKEKLKHLNILDFGSNLKIYDEKEKKYKQKVILEKIDKQLDEIYYDYDKSNKKVIINSFAGNNAELLKNKVSFVTGIMNYLYPKIVLNKMEFLKKMKNRELKAEKIQLEYDLKGKYYNLKHKTPKEIVSVSKYFYMVDFDNLKYGKYLIRPKAIVNNNVISKLKFKYDFM